MVVGVVGGCAGCGRPVVSRLVDVGGWWGRGRGSAFSDCARLPHTVGLVTDLDRHLTERALVSLSAELKQRELVLAEAGATDIDDDVARGEPVDALPRPVIVIDEFAGLVNELPDSVTGLWASPSRAARLVYTSYWPRSAPPGWSVQRSEPTPTCGWRSG